MTARKAPEPSYPMPRSLDDWLEKEYDQFVARAAHRGIDYERQANPRLDSDFMERIGERLVRIWGRIEENKLV